MAGMLDIVDDNDAVVGTAHSDEVHAKGLLHRFVQVMVVGSDGRVLLQQRSRTKARGPLLLDASVGGHVDAGETYDEAAVREAREEIGLDVPLRFIGNIRDDSLPVENMVGHLYLARSDGPFTGWETEAERVFWLDPVELLAMTRSVPFLFTGPMPQVAAIVAKLGNLSAAAQARLQRNADELRSWFDRMPEWPRRGTADAIERRFLALLPDVGEFRLLGDAGALSLLRSTLLDDIERERGPNAVSCFWHRRNPTGLPGFPEAIENLRRYRETRTVGGPVVAFVPFVAERSVARHVLLTAASDWPDRDLHLVCLAGRKSELGLLFDEVRDITGRRVSAHCGRQTENAAAAWDRIAAIPSSAWSADTRAVPAIVARRLHRAIRALYDVE